MRSFLLFTLAGLVLISQPASADPTADSRKTAESKYPELRDTQSIFSMAYASEEAALRKSQPTFFSDENWPLMLAFRVAGKLGKTGTSNDSSKPQNSARAVVPSASKISHSKRATMEQMTYNVGLVKSLSAAKQMPDDELDQLYRQALQIMQLKNSLLPR